MPWGDNNIYEINLSLATIYGKFFRQKETGKITGILLG